MDAAALVALEETIRGRSKKSKKRRKPAGELSEASPAHSGAERNPLLVTGAEAHEPDGLSLTQYIDDMERLVDEGVHSPSGRRRAPQFDDKSPERTQRIQPGDRIIYRASAEPCNETPPHRLPDRYSAPPHVPLPPDDGTARQPAGDQHGCLHYRQRGNAPVGEEKAHQQLRRQTSYGGGKQKCKYPLCMASAHY